MSEEREIPILSRLAPPPGAVRRRRRVGRGIGSGLGKTCGKGQKGQRSRGPLKKPHFEGGQMPIQRRLPKVGFNNIFARELLPVNVGALSVFEDGATVDEAALREKRLVRGRFDGVKILGQGELDKKLTLKVHGVSASAKEKIEKAGGAVEVIAAPVRGPKAKR